MVPTVERGERGVVFCSIAMEGEIPSTRTVLGMIAAGLTIALVDPARFMAPHKQPAPVDRLRSTQRVGGPVGQDRLRLQLGQLVPGPETVVVAV